MQNIYKGTIGEFSELVEEIQRDKENLLKSYDLGGLDETVAVIILKKVLKYTMKMSSKHKKISHMFLVLEHILQTGELDFLQVGEEVDVIIEAGIARFRVATLDVRERMMMYDAELLQLYYKQFEDNDCLEENRVINEIYSRMRAQLEKEGNTDSPDSHSFPIRLFNHLNESIVGQESMKKKLVMCIHDYVNHGVRRNLLLIGPSGSGKNYTMEVLSEFEPIKKEMAVLCFNASKLTATGYTGSSVEDIFKEFSRLCMVQRKSKERGIIYVDEIDKIVYPNTDSNGENSSYRVQYELLSVLSGTDSYSGIESGNLLFILGGAFEELEKYRESKKKNNIIGFVDEEKVENRYEKEASLKDDLRDIGAIKEFLGRIHSIALLQRLGKEELKDILFHKRSAFRRRREVLQKDGLDVQILPDAVQALIDKIDEEDLGARSVETYLESIIGEHAYALFLSEYDTMLITQDTIKYGNPPKFCNRAENS